MRGWVIVVTCSTATLVLWRPVLILCANVCKTRAQFRKARCEEHVLTAVSTLRLKKRSTVRLCTYIVPSDEDPRRGMGWWDYEARHTIFRPSPISLWLQGRMGKESEIAATGGAETLFLSPPVRPLCIIFTGELFEKTGVAQRGKIFTDLHY